MAAVLVLLGLGVGCHSPGVSDRETIVAENRAFNRQMASAIESRDPDGMMALIWKSPDVIFVGPEGEVARGWDQIRGIEEKFLGSLQSAKVAFEDESYTVTGETVVAVLTVKLTAMPGGGETARELRVRLADVRTRHDGRWVTIYNHSHRLEEAAPPADQQR